MKQIYTLTVYINEYNEEFMTQLSNNRINGLYCYGGSEKCLYIQGTEEDLDKLISLMYAPADKIKAVFPDFTTAADIACKRSEVYNRIMGTIRDSILELDATARGTGFASIGRENTAVNDFLRKMLDVYVDEIDRQREEANANKQRITK